MNLKNEKEKRILNFYLKKKYPIEKIGYEKISESNEPRPDFLLSNNHLIEIKIITDEEFYKPSTSIKSIITIVNNSLKSRNITGEFLIRFPFFQFPTSDHAKIAKLIIERIEIILEKKISSEELENSSPQIKYMPSNILSTFSSTLLMNSGTREEKMFKIIEKNLVKANKQLDKYTCNSILKKICLLSLEHQTGDHFLLWESNGFKKFAQNLNRYKSTDEIYIFNLTDMKSKTIYIKRLENEMHYEWIEWHRTF